MTFETLMRATMRQFVWSDRIDRFVRFLPRKDGNFDVDAITEEAFAKVHGPHALLFAAQYPAVPMDTETLNLLVALCAGLSILHNTPRVESVSLVVSPVGLTLDLPRELRVVGL